MNLFRTTALVLALTTGLSSMPALADAVQGKRQRRPDVHRRSAPRTP